MKDKAGGYICILIASAFWACIGPVAKVAFAEGMNPLEVGFWRIVTGGIAFTAHALLRRQYRISPKDLPGIIVFAFFCIAVFFSAYQISVERGGAALACVLLYTAPAWVAVLSRLFLGEALTRIRILSIVFSILGAAAVAFGVDGDQQIIVSPLAVGCGVLAGFTYSMSYILGKKFLQNYSGATIFMYAVPFALVFLFPFVSFSVPSVKAIFAVVFLGLVSTYGAYCFYYLALANLDASRVAVVATVEPVLAAIMAFIWWSERFTFWGYAGGILILTGVLLTVTETSRLQHE